MVCPTPTTLLCHHADRRRGCVTPVQLENWWEIAEQDVGLIDGYDELPDDAKAKVKRALEQGHVDDEDWKGDVEKNRHGQKGFRLSKKEQAKKDAEVSCCCAYAMCDPMILLARENKPRITFTLPY